MKLDLSNGLSESVLAKIRKHSTGTETLKTRALTCHFCEHKAVIVYEDSRGHIQTKCQKCRKQSIHNVAFRRIRDVMFRRVRS